MKKIKNISSNHIYLCKHTHTYMCMHTLTNRMYLCHKLIYFLAVILIFTSLLQAALLVYVSGYII